MNTFKWVHSYSILTCENGGHSLVESDDHNPNGEDVIKRRGPLYLAIKDSNDYVVSVIFSDVKISDPPPPPPPRGGGTIICEVKRQVLMFKGA